MFISRLQFYFVFLLCLVSCSGQSLVLLLVRMVVQQVSEMKQRQPASGTQRRTLMVQNLMKGLFNPSLVHEGLDVWNFTDYAMALALADWTALSTALMDGTQQPR